MYLLCLSLELFLFGDPFLVVVKVANQVPKRPKGQDGSGGDSEKVILQREDHVLLDSLSHWSCHSIILNRRDIMMF